MLTHLPLSQSISKVRALFFMLICLWLSPCFMTIGAVQIEAQLDEKNATVTLNWQLQAGLHMYDPNCHHPFANPPVIDFPPEVNVIKTVWSPPVDLSDTLPESLRSNKPLTGYQNQAQTIITLEKIPSAPFHIEITAPLCDKVCRVEKISLTVSPQQMAGDQIPRPVDTTTVSQNIVITLFLAFLGGILLNVMPCVFPVLGLKLLSFNQSRQWIWGYTAGILFAMIGLAVVMIMLQMGGQQLGWGFQMQSPAFLVCLCIIFLIIALNLLNVFQINANFMGGGISSPPLVESFLQGTLLCVVATPCSAPFMGTAITYGLSHSYSVQVLIFIFLGLGLAFPMILLSLFPFYSLPKSGPWLLHIKSALGFLMLGSCLWHVWILSHHSVALLPVLLGVLWMIGVLLWIYGHIQGRGGHIAKIPLIAIVGISSFLLYDASAPKELDMSLYHAYFHPFSQQGLDDALKNGHDVIIDFTAKWCVTCQVNKQTAFTEKVFDFMKEHKVMAFTADWTHTNPLVTEKLQSFGYNSIPVVVYISHKNPTNPRSINSLMTEEDMLSLLQRENK